MLREQNPPSVSAFRAYIQERRVSEYNLKGHNKLEISQVKTTTHGLRSFRYLAPHSWNNLAHIIRTSETLATFKRKIIDYIYQEFFFFCIFSLSLENVEL